MESILIFKWFFSIHTNTNKKKNFVVHKKCTSSGHLRLRFQLGFWVFFFFLINKLTVVLKVEFHTCRGLKSITDREVCCYMISCKNSTNIDTVIDWLVKHSKSKNWASAFKFFMLDLELLKASAVLSNQAYLLVWPWSFSIWLQLHYYLLCGVNI